MIVVLKRRTLVVLVIGMALLITCVISIASLVDKANAAPTAATERRLPVYSVQRDDKVLAISFDAAWGADKTQGILDCLREQDAKATFFLTGFWIEKYPDMVRAIDRAGMEIANHSDNHLMNTKLGAEELTREIVTVNDMIRELTGKTPRYYRCPFGDYNDGVIAGVEALGMQAIQWSIDSLDWKGLSAAELESRIIPKAGNGDIILCHNNSDHILDALPTILSRLKEAGYTFVTMSELVYADNYHIDHNGRQIPDERSKENTTEQGENR